MNYKFFSALAFVVSMYTPVQADVSVGAPKHTPVIQKSQKIGYVDVLSILNNLPETQKNNADFQVFNSQLESQYKAKYKEFQEKVDAFQQQANTLTEPQRKQRHTEIEKLEFALGEFQRTANVKLTQKYRELMKPLRDKIQGVINNLAKEHKYDFILNKCDENRNVENIQPMVLYANPEFDLTNLVLEKLKAMAPKEAQPPVVGAKKEFPAKSSASSATSPKKK